MGQGYFQDDTIVAIATAADVVSAIGIIRISGPCAIDVFLKLAKKTGDLGFFSSNELESHRFRRCLIVSSTGQILDDALFVWMKGPNSFTGEDVVELHLHGNPFNLKRILTAAIHAGARPALAGEFSFRAFRSGKIDLSQAEAIMDIVAGHTPQGIDGALNSLLGSTKGMVDSLKAELLHLLAMIEVDIDFSDQGLSSIDYPALGSRMASWCKSVRSIRDRFQKSLPQREGVRVAIVGAPNSGKSTLFNVLVGDDRSIVSGQAGTTRDIIRERLLLSGKVFLLADTAGIRKTDDEVESQGIARSFSEVGDSRLVIWVIDGSLETNESLLGQQLSILRENSANSSILAVISKADLGAPRATLLDWLRSQDLPVLEVSALQNLGVSLLEERMAAICADVGPGDGFSVGRMRHFELLGKALERVEGAIDRISGYDELPDLLASDLRSALSSLGEITGDVTADDVLNHIFSEFCIGK